ncbi:MAG: branched-chain amino acid ABC transporter permease, partial [Alcaligenaceae bacterium]|nr:branched-chain amino acid ABC transporter permease [Alcaligenaceae bacterium]
MSYFLELLINGALTGLMYGLAALGFVLIYKSSGVVNLAQGAMIMLAGYIVWLLYAAGLPISLAIVGGMVLMFLFGLLAERVLLRKMVGQPIIMIVMLTLGLEIFLRGVGPGFLGAAPKQIDIGVSLAPIIVGDIFINRIYLVGGIIALILIVASMLFFRTRMGTKLRAVSDDHVSSWSVGISVERAIGISW